MTTRLPFAMRLTLLLMASFSGVLLLKEIPSPWFRHFALAVWFIFQAILMKRFGVSKPLDKSDTLRINSPAGWARTLTKLNEKDVFDTWLGKPQSTFGVTVVTLYAAVSFMMYTLGDSDNQWQSISKVLLFSASNMTSLFLSCVFVPLYEELYFRAALLPAQVSRQRAPGARGCAEASMFTIYMNGLVFWLFHLPSDGAFLWDSLQKGVVPLALGPFLLGMACAVVCSRDRSVWAAVVLHGLANGAGPLWEPVLSRTGLLGAFYSY
jgi:membrane protease YdiL (CAAX protease family)